MFICQMYIIKDIDFISYPNIFELQVPPLQIRLRL